MKKHEYLQEEDHYEENPINRGRIDKYCEHCGKLIPKGQPHMTHKFYPEFDTYATHTMHPDHGDRLQPGEVSCSDQFVESLN